MLVNFTLLVLVSQTFNIFVVYNKESFALFLYCVICFKSKMWQFNLASTDSELFSYKLSSHSTHINILKIMLMLLFMEASAFLVLAKLIV